MQVTHCHNEGNLQMGVSHLLSAAALILATVDAAMGTPRVEPRVTLARVAQPLLPSEPLERKLGNVSSSRFRKLSMSV